MKKTDAYILYSVNNAGLVIPFRKNYKKARFKRQLGRQNFWNFWHGFHKNECKQKDFKDASKVSHRVQMKKR